MPFRTLREGDFFGEENLQAFSNLDYTVICLQDNSEIAFLEKNSFEQSVESYERIVQRAKMQVKYVTSWFTWIKHRSKQSRIVFFHMNSLYLFIFWLQSLKINRKIIRKSMRPLSLPKFPRQPVSTLFNQMPVEYRLNFIMPRSWDLWFGTLSA